MKFSSVTHKTTNISVYKFESKKYKASVTVYKSIKEASCILWDTETRIVRAESAMIDIDMRSIVRDAKAIANKTKRAYKAELLSK